MSLTHAELDAGLEALGQSIVANSAGSIVAWKVEFGELTVSA